MKLGVVPAAGTATRFGGTRKELLPISKNEAVIDRSMTALGRATDAILVVTSQEKLPILAQYLDSRQYGAPVFYAIQGGGNDIMGAILTALDFPAERYLFAMPDTLIEDDAFAIYPSTDFSMGLFETDTPERFGVLTGRRIFNKQAAAHLSSPSPWPAWGILSWTQQCAYYWQELVLRYRLDANIVDGINDELDYTTAINGAIERFGLSHWQMGTYRDMADIYEYQAYWRDLERTPVNPEEEYEAVAA